MQAAGRFLQVVRESRGYSRTQVAAACETSEAQIMRIEAGKIDTRSSLIFAIVDYLGASAENLRRLIVDPKATAEDGERMALALLDSSEIAALIRTATPSRRREIAERLRQMADDLED